VGTAEVAERILDDFHHSRLRSAQNIINYELIPFLIHWGYPLEGASGRFPALDEKAAPTDSPKGEEKEDKDGSDIDPDEQESEGGEKKTAAALKKKARLVVPW